MRNIKVLDKNEINLFAHLVKDNYISLEQAINWCYKQYTETGAPHWIEALTLTTDKSEFLEIISTKFDLYGELSFDFMAGEAVYKYKKGEVDLYQTISFLLFDLFIEEENSKEKSDLYLAEDYYGWHKAPDAEALKVISKTFEKYYLIYNNSRSLLGL